MSEEIEQLLAERPDDGERRAVELSMREWRVIEYLARSGTVAEAAQAEAIPGSYKPGVIRVFAAAAMTLAERIFLGK